MIASSILGDFIICFLGDIMNVYDIGSILGDFIICFLRDIMNVLDINMLLGGAWDSQWRVVRPGDPC